MNDRIISRVGLVAGIGDALNARSFLITYCDQKNLPRKLIRIYTEKYWWMFEGLGFTRGMDHREFRGLTGYRNFGNYDLKKVIDMDKCDECIAKNAGIKYNFDVVTPFLDFGPACVPLPEKFITVNTGYGLLSGNNKPGYVCTKVWPVEYWEELVKNIGVPCVQIGGNASCTPLKNVYANYSNKLTIQESAAVLKRSMFHIDIEGGLPILKQHLGGRSVVLFGPTAIENQGRHMNLNLRAKTCTPCYEWGTHKYGLSVLKTKLACKAHCMTDLKPEYVVEQIFKAGWLK